GQASAGGAASPPAGGLPPGALADRGVTGTSAGAGAGDLLSRRTRPGRGGNPDPGRGLPRARSVRPGRRFGRGCCRSPASAPGRRAAVRRPVGPAAR
ncbi:hypothetical protein AB1460_35635, partial [Parafrankia sp. FMc2]